MHRHSAYRIARISARDLLPGIPYFLLVCIAACQADLHNDTADQAHHMPVAWTTYEPVKSIDADFRDLKQHGLGAVIVGSFEAAPDLEMAGEYLQASRKHGIKVAVRTGNHLLPNADIVYEAGLVPEYAVMIGGVYQGKAIDRHLFAFSAGPQQIIIEPPVYNQHFAYTGRVSNEPIGHYYPGIGDPIRAEIVLPLKEYDGQQHLEIMQVPVTRIDGIHRLESESVSVDMPKSYEIANRNLYQLSFDLSNFEHALLDRVGIAVYWEYRGSKEWYILDWAPVSVSAESTVRAVRSKVQSTLTTWTDANGGTFPAEALIALRFGDEPFYITGHIDENSPSVNYPLWDYSTSGVRTFWEIAGDLHYPRTWGFPEIYGSDAYSCWLYALHKNCARITGIAREEAKKIHPDIRVFRNTSRMGVFSLANDHDGSGPELLTRQLDLAHIDPYPVSTAGYGQDIPRDMSYYGGLARRYDKPLVPWMQAHRYGTLTHVGPEHITRMTEEQWNQGVDAVMWLGYGPHYTFPDVNKESWDAAGTFHHKLAARKAPKSRPGLAVVRSYDAWALTSLAEDRIRNPADWLLQQWLEVWAVRHHRPYDVFELAPGLSGLGLDSMRSLIDKYDQVVSNIPFRNAWFVADTIDQRSIKYGAAHRHQNQFEAAMKRKGWL